MRHVGANLKKNKLVSETNEVFAVSTIDVLHQPAKIVRLRSDIYTLSR